MCYPTVAAGLRITLANNAYTAREVAYQYTDSGAKVIFCSEDGVPTARETLQGLGLSKDEINKRIVVMTDGLDWAGGPSAPRKPESAGLLSAADLLRLGSLSEEEKFVGESTNETVYLCYSSGALTSEYLCCSSRNILTCALRYHWQTQGRRGMCREYHVSDFQFSFKLL